MVEIEYLSIAEFAAIARVSKQAIYKQVKNKNSQLSSYLLRDGKKTLIKINALSELYGVETEKLNLSTQNREIKTTFSTNEEGTEVENTTLKAENTTQENQPLNQVSTQENQPLSTDYIEFLKAQIAELKTEKAEIEQRLTATIQEKDHIIQEQSAQLSDLAQKVAQIADKALIATSQQQYLTALEKTGEREEAPPVAAPIDMEPPKKTLFQRIFGK